MQRWYGWRRGAADKFRIVSDKPPGGGGVARKNAGAGAKRAEGGAPMIRCMDGTHNT